MSKQIKKLSQEEQEAMELKYHQMNPEDFDEEMKHAKRHVPRVIRLSPQLVETLQALAEARGESEYQEMVTRWIEERLQHEGLAVGAH